MRRLQILLCAAALLGGTQLQAADNTVTCHETIQVTYPFVSEGSDQNNVFPYQAVDIEVTYKTGDKLDFTLKNFVLEATEKINVGNIELTEIAYTKANEVKTLPTTKLKASIKDGSLPGVDAESWLNHGGLYSEGVDVTFGANSTIDPDNNLDLTLTVALGDALGNVKVVIGGDLPTLLKESTSITFGSTSTSTESEILADVDNEGKLTLTLNDFTLPTQPEIKVGTIKIEGITTQNVAGKDDQKSFTVPEKAITIGKYTDGTNGMAGTEVKVTINDGLLYNGGEKIYVSLKVNAGSTAPLDNIQVKVGEKPAALRAPKAVKATSSEAIYDLNGRFCGTSLEALPAGTYINGGKLVNKK